MKQINKTLSYIGICKKAGKLVTGTELSCEAIRSGKAMLAVYCADASENTVKRVKNCCAFYKVDCLRGDFASAELGHTVGKSAPVAVVAITDAGLAGATADSIRKKT